MQCYATRTKDGCAPLSAHATMGECRALAEEYQKFDTRALNVTELPVVVSYDCMAAEPAASRLNVPSSPPQQLPREGLGHRVAGAALLVHGDRQPELLAV